MKNMFCFLKSFVCAPFVLYIFNLMTIGLDVYVPINLLTIITVGFLKISGLIMLIIYFVFIL